MHEYGRLGCTVGTESDDVEQLHLLSHCRERARRATVHRAKLDSSRRALPHVDPMEAWNEPFLQVITHPGVIDFGVRQEYR